MQQLTRQRTRDSIFSWWSDSNPGLNGPTINLHTLAKPLMRRMYDRDALKYIQKQRGIPLSAESVEIYLSYLLWKYVSPSTKEEIVEDLAERVMFEDDALTVVHSNIFPNIRVLFPSKFVAGFILALTRDKSTTSTACSSLVDLLSDGDGDIVDWAWYGLSAVAEISEGGAEAVVNAKALDYVPRGFLSPISSRSVVNMVFNLGRHPSMALTICLSLVNLLSDGDFDVVQLAWKALSDIAGSSEGSANAVVEAKVLDHVLRGLLSIRSVADTVFNLAQQPSTALAACSSLVDLLSDGNVYIVESAWAKLSVIAKSSEKGAEAVLDANVLDHLHGGLSSPIARRDVRNVLSTLTRCPSTTLAACSSLVHILSNDDAEVVELAWTTVADIAGSDDGAKVAVEAEVLDHVSKGLVSSIASVRYSACRTVSYIAGFMSTLPAAIASPEVFIGANSDPDVDQTAWRAVSEIATSPLGAEALVKANVLNLVPWALLSRDIEVWSAACEVVERLAGQESTFPVVIRALPEFLGVFALFNDVNVIQRASVDGIILALVRHKSTALAVSLPLVDLLSDGDVNIVTSAWIGFERIIRWEGGAEAVLGAKVLDHLPGGLSLPNARRHVRNVVFALTDHPSTASAACSSLIHLLSNGDAEVVESAWEALADVAGSSDNSAKFAAEAKVLDHVLKGLLSPIASVRYSACRTVCSVARFMSTLPPVIGALPEFLDPLFTLLNDANVDQTAWRAVSEIATSPLGAEALVKANVLDLVPGALSSPHTRSTVSQLVEILVRHESTMPAVMHAFPNFLVTFVNLLDDAHDSDFCSALVIMAYIARSSEGAEAAVAANILSIMTHWLLSSDPVLKARAYDLLRQLGRHDPTLSAIVRTGPRELIVSLSRQHSYNTHVQDKAKQIVDKIEAWLETVRHDRNGMERMFTEVQNPLLDLDPTLEELECE